MLNNLGIPKLLGLNKKAERLSLIFRLKNAVIQVYALELLTVLVLVIISGNYLYSMDNKTKNSILESINRNIVQVLNSHPESCIGQYCIVDTRDLMDADKLKCMYIYKGE